MTKANDSAQLASYQGFYFQSIVIRDGAGWVYSEAVSVSLFMYAEMQLRKLYSYQWV